MSSDPSLLATSDAAAIDRDGISQEELPASRRASEYLDHPQRPELVIGLVAPIGTPLEGFTGALERALHERRYATRVHRLTALLERDAAPCGGEEPVGSESFKRYMRLMTQGDQLRERTKAPDILALYAALSIGEMRVEQRGAKPMPGTAHIVRQLKHPEEVYRLRSIYGDAFLLLGLYCPPEIRERHLEDKGISSAEIRVLMQRDEEESSKYGQKLAETFHLADAFVEVLGAAMQRDERPRLVDELERFLNLLFGRGVVTPTRDEFAMFIAYAAALRSSSLARQVGAAIVSPEGELISTGTNEVPMYGGGQYWGERGDPDHRDHAEGVDLSDRKKYELVSEILAKLDPEWHTLDADQRAGRTEQALINLKGTQLLSLTEFMRAVHAEMEALSAAARAGVRVRRATLYSTTFPCHNCAKHIVAAGIDRVIYIEPYSKSRALEMHGDAITLDRAGEGKVRFLPFVGVAPRKYLELFARSTKEGRKLKAKDDRGMPLAEIGFRLGALAYSYVERESIAAEILSHLRKEHENAFSDAA